MKKNQIAALFLSGALSLTAVPSVSADGIPSSLLVTAQETYTVSVNERRLELGTHTPYISGEQIMIPLRLVSETLDFQIFWNGEEQSVHLDNGEVNTTLRIGHDCYYMASSTAIGMSAPCSLGAAPELKEGSTYVPANLFQILFCDKNAVQVNGNTITITSTPQSSVQIPNPLQSYKTVEEALKALPFEARIPSALPAGYAFSSVNIISKEILQIVYLNGDNEIAYRTAEGSTDISGDYNTYEFTKTDSIFDCIVTAKGNGEKIFNAAWEKDGKCYALFAENGLSADELKTILAGIK